MAPHTLIGYKLIAFLLLLFALAFALPVYFTLNFVDDFYSDEQSGQAFAEKKFPQAFRVQGRGFYYSVKHSQQLIPRKDKEQGFLVAVWVKPKNFPDLNQKIIFLSKHDAHDRSRRGFALALKRENDSFIPLVYWRNGMGQGSWYPFSAVNALPKSWFMLALSYYDGKLGIHSITTEKSGSEVISLNGGHDLTDISTISTAYSFSDLRVGAHGNGWYKGKVGPVGIFSTTDLAQILMPALQELVKTPTQIPSVFEDKDVKLWTLDGHTDLSSYQHEIRTFTRQIRKEGKQFESSA